MKNQTQIIISFILAIIAGIIDYVNLAVSESLCYYAGDGHENFLEIRNVCYAQYSTARFLVEIFFVSLITYFVAFYVLKILRDRKAKKFKNIQ